MGESYKTYSLEEPLDIFGQNPRLSRLYTQLAFCFPLPNIESQTQEAIVNLLRRGLQVLSSHFAWTSGQVIKDNQGIFKIVPFEQTPRLITRNHCDDFPSFGEYEKAGFPFKWLQESSIASRNTLPERPDDPAPVLALQANFIDGGLLLVFSAQHNCMDMAGQCQVISLLAKACRGDPYSNEELETGHLARQDIIPVFDRLPSRSPSPLKNGRSNRNPEIPLAEPGERGKWTYFLFSASSSSLLKDLAMKDVSTGYISTDDTLSAFIWKALTRARLSRARSRLTESTFERQIDVRKHLGIPPMYTGNVVYKTSTVMTVEDLVSQPLGFIASQLRSSLSPPARITYKAREAATLLQQKLQSHQHDDATMKRATVPSFDIKMSSWAKERCYELDFGDILGKAEAVRRPDFEAWEGLAYFMPRTKDGDIAAALCLRNSDLEALRADEEFAKYGKYIG